jgi:large subunit ribosomal protein L3
MAGRMGSERVTVKGLEVVGVDNEKNLLIVKGLIPGGKGGLVYIKKV